MTHGYGSRVGTRLGLRLIMGVAVFSLANGAFADTPPVVDFDVAGDVTTAPVDVAAGADGNLWFTQGSSSIGRITPTGTITEFPLPVGGGSGSITAGPDGNVWFTDVGSLAIGRIDPTQADVACQTDGHCITEYAVPGALSPGDITAGPDGNVWFTVPYASYPVEPYWSIIGRITPAGTITTFPLPAGTQSWYITGGPDGKVWFSESIYGPDNRVGRIDPAQADSACQTDRHCITDFAAPAGKCPSSVGPITAGPDGNLWFGNDWTCAAIGQMTPTGSYGFFPFPTWPWGPNAITGGPDANVWYTVSGRIGRITPAGTITEFALTTDGPWGITAGPDENLWFVYGPEFSRGIGRLQTNTGEAFVSDGPAHLSRDLASNTLTGSIGLQNDAQVRVFGAAVNLGGALTLSGNVAGSNFTLAAKGTVCSGCDGSCNSCGASCTLCLAETGTVSCPPAAGSCSNGGQRFTGTVSTVTGALAAGLPPGLTYQGNVNIYRTTTTPSAASYDGVFALNAFQPVALGVQTQTVPNVTLSNPALYGTVQVGLTYEGQCSNNASVTCTDNTQCGAGTCTGGVTAGQCSNDSSVSCTTNAQCGTGTCTSGTFVAPSPLPTGGELDPNFTLQSKVCSNKSDLCCETDADCVPTYGTCSVPYEAFPFDVATTATTAGTKKVCLHYLCENLYTGKCRDNYFDPQGLTGNDYVFQRDAKNSAYYMTEKSLNILHKNPNTGMYEPVTTSRDYKGNVICAEVTSLSPFLVALSSNIPGGGSAKTDCISEWNAGPRVAFDRKGVTKNRVVCRDGNPCDGGGGTPDGQCNFTISVCPNVMDSRLPACSPTDVAAYTLTAPLPDARNTTDAANAAVILSGLEGLGTNAVSGRHHNVVTYTTPVAATGCATGIPITVPVQVDRKGVKHPGSKVISLKAVTSGKVTDSDLLTLVCQP